MHMVKSRTTEWFTQLVSLRSQLMRKVVIRLPPRDRHEVKNNIPVRRVTVSCLRGYVVCILMARGTAS